MGKAFEITPRPASPVATRYRRIVTAIPAPGSVPVLLALQKYEPLSMTGQPPIVWHRAEGFQVYDGFGNMWLDWSSRVLVANSGHAAPEICSAIKAQVDQCLLHNYCFPSAERAELAEYLVRLAPPGLTKVFLLTTGSETTENAIKLARAYSQHRGRPERLVIVSFERAFHGRTLGAQQIGGNSAQKSWIGHLDPNMVQVPFPDGFRTKDTSFETFERSLAAQGIAADRVAAVISETYQGGGASFAPPEYMQAMAEWCHDHAALLVFDEVQAGVGRTGKQWGFEHYGVVPDLICCGKGISSSGSPAYSGILAHCQKIW